MRFVKALVNSGSASYATISEKVAKELKLPKIPIQPRVVEGVVDAVNGEIRHVTHVEMDIGGYPLNWRKVPPPL